MLSETFCSEHSCNDCPIQKLDTTYYCPDIRKEYPEDVVKVLKQWKADHEKKPIETKWVWYVKIIEADTHLLKHEELLELDFSIPMDRKKEEILKKWLNLILSGKKTIEIRGSNTKKIGQPIYLLESGTNLVKGTCIIDSTYPMHSM